MNVLVTGSTGFVGRHVVSLLLERGHKVTAVSRDEAKARNFAWFDHVRFIACDIRGPIDSPAEGFGQPNAAVPTLSITAN
jgi:dTDP-6-deoxy-L-talose 4-dehydrogenase (NAD+)